MDPPALLVAEAAPGGVQGWISAIGISLLLGISTVVWMRYYGNPLLQEDKTEDDEEEEEERVTQEIPPEHMPKDGIFTIKSLKRFDGFDLPICMGVCGEVVNVSSSSNIQPGQQGYGKLWAGNDATYSLATLSLNAEDADKLDYTLEDFTPEQQKALAGWYKHFTTKYPVIGTMKEYTGWDFSTIHELAKNETPFASSQKATGDSKKGDSTKVEKATAEKDAAEKPAAENAARDEAESSAQANSSARESREKELEFSTGEKIQIPEDAQVLRRGCRVTISGLDVSKNGRQGTLVDFNAQKVKFEVMMIDTAELEFFGPEHLIVI